MSYKRISPIPVDEGGSGAINFTAYAVLCGGTTTTNPLQSIAALGSAGEVLTSNGAGALPTFQAIPASGVTSITGDTGGAQTGAITLTGGTTGASYGGAAGTITMTFAGITANGGTVNLGTDATDNAINIGTAASAGRTVTIGNTTGTSDLDLRCGTGDFTLASATGTIVSASDTGQINYPLQPAFLAVHGVAQDNVTGAGAVITVNFTTEIFDQNNNYDGTNTFTAPVTGRYQFNAGVQIGDLAAGGTADCFVRFNTSNRGYLSNELAYFTIRNTSNNAVSLNASTLADMDAGDTCLVDVRVNGMAGNTADLPAAADRTFFSGYLVA